jgi:hypothetical protein
MSGRNMIRSKVKHPSNTTYQEGGRMAASLYPPNVSMLKYPKINLKRFSL